MNNCKGVLLYQGVLFFFTPIIPYYIQKRETVSTLKFVLPLPD